MLGSDQWSRDCSVVLTSHLPHHSHGHFWACLIHRVYFPSLLQKRPGDLELFGFFIYVGTGSGLQERKQAHRKQDPSKHAFSGPVPLLSDMCGLAVHVGMQQQRPLLVLRFFCLAAILVFSHGCATSDRRPKKASARPCAAKGFRLVFFRVMHPHICSLPLALAVSSCAEPFAKLAPSQGVWLEA